MANNDGGIPEIVQAKKFELVNDAGEVRAELRTDSGDASELVLHGKNGHGGAYIVADGQGSSALSLFNKAGKPTVSLRTDSNESSWLTLSDAHGQPAIQVAVEETNLPSLMLVGQDEKTQLQLAFREEGALGLFIVDSSGQTRAGLALSDDNSAIISLFSHNDNGHIQVGTDDTGFPGLGLIDRNGEMRAQLTLSEDGSASLGFGDSSGNMRWIGASDSEASPPKAIPNFIGKDELNQEVVSEVLERAYLKPEIDPDRDIKFEGLSGFTHFAHLRRRKDIIRIFSIFPFAAEHKTGEEKLRFVNRLNERFVLVRFAMRRENSLQADYNLVTEEGITPLQLLSAVKVFDRIVMDAIREVRDFVRRKPDDADEE